MNDDMEALGLQPEWAVFKNMGRDFILEQTSKPIWVWKKLTFSK